MGTPAATHQSNCPTAKPTGGCSLSERSPEGRVVRGHTAERAGLVAESLGTGGADVTCEGAGMGKLAGKRCAGKHPPLP